MIYDLGLTFLGAFLGAVLFIIPAFLDYLSYRKKPALLGTWYGKYQSNYENPGQWVLEDIEIKPGMGKLKFLPTNNEMGYDPSGLASPSRNGSIIGEWKSEKVGAHLSASGSFLLRVSPTGDLKYGYYNGPTEGGEIKYGKWCLAKDKSRLNRAKIILDSSTREYVSNIENSV